MNLDSFDWRKEEEEEEEKEENNRHYKRKREKAKGYLVEPTLVTFSIQGRKAETKNRGLRINANIGTTHDKNHIPGKGKECQRAILNF
ncbi:hypothetical protein BPOR_1250g00010 [Botrytis porri]|uniref:Uncharacterized protein n=1 Tax=Botrytis porri TaxID=87229 RepID=A0A4Z1K6X5_9HELO|nr:hypothetical protein BPOR_1250g00010 [Botrytis porri]